ncbi:MAG: phenylphosphate carboxylase subunit delta, partial [Planctomycetaceae bacterium]
MPTPADLDRRLSRVELLLLDVDGVLTDGGVTLGPDGEDWKTFHIRDGLGLRAWRRAGLQAGIVTGRTSRVVERRAAELGIGILR